MKREHDPGLRDAATAATKERRKLAGAPSVSEAGIWPIDKQSLPMGSPERAPSSEGDKE